VDQAAIDREKDTEISHFYKEVLGCSLPMDEGRLAGASPITKSFHAQWEIYEIVGGIMYRRWWEKGETVRSRQKVLPIQYQEEAMRSAHASVSGGHMGVKKTQDKVAMIVYWVGWPTRCEEILSKMRRLRSVS